MTSRDHWHWRFPIAALFVVLFMATVAAAESPAVSGAVEDQVRMTEANADSTVTAWIAGSNVALWWEPIEGAAGYQVVRLDRHAAPQTLTERALTEPHFIDVTAAAREAVAYEVIATMSDGSQVRHPLVMVGDVPARDRSRIATHAVHGPANIISDAEFVAPVTLAQVRGFLQSVNSFLANPLVDTDGAVIDPAQVIYSAAAEHQISAYVILATLQKEQGVVTISPANAPSPTSQKIKCAMGYGCPNYVGFATQVRSATAQFRRYLNDLNGSRRETVSGWRVGAPKATQDCMTITPANAATAGLYTYNPLVGVGWGGCTTFGANWLFWDIYYNRFRFAAGTTPPPPPPPPAPSGNLIVNGGFESGNSSWTPSGNFYASTGRSFPRGGSGYAYLSQPDGAAGNNLNGSLYQTVNIPSNVTSATLSFWYSITSDELTTVTAYDSLTVTLRDQSNNVLGVVKNLSNLNETSSPSSYQNVVYTLGSSYAGRTVRVHFSGSTDGSLPTVFRIDDVSLTASGGSPATSYTLTVQSQNPSSGAAVTISPADVNQLGSGTTPFSRSYRSGTTVSLTAPSSAGANGFLVWLKNGSEYSYNRAVSVLIDRAVTMTAVYQASAPPTCSGFTISTPSISTGTGAGSQSISISASPAGCSGGSWSASTNAPWLSVTPQSGSGPATVTVSWTQNSAGARSATATIAGRTLTVSQSGTTTIPTCTSFTIAPAAIQAAAASGSQAVTITGVPAGCVGRSWTSSGAASWISTSPQNGTGPGVVMVTWTENASGAARTGTASVAGNTFSITQSKRVTSAGARSDFNQDGRSEIVWRNQADGSCAIWELNGRTLLNGAVFALLPDSNWKFMAIGDFNGDGYDDLFLRHAVTGANAVWLMRGRTILVNAATASVTDMRWQLQATGDFNADGKDELIWRHTATGAVALWEMNGATLLNGAVIYTVSDPAWQIQLAADFNGDGRDELLWRHTSTNALALWDMQGRTLLNGAVFAAVSDPGWQIISVGDYNRDGKDDLLWRHAGTGMVAMWEMSHRAILNGRAMFTVSLDWEPQRSGDFDGDGDDEVLWRNLRTGDVSMWDLNGHTLTNGGVIWRVADQNWKMVPRGGVRPSLGAQ